jgi:hypothetical protein
MNATKAARNQTVFREVNERIKNLDYTVPRAPSSSVSASTWNARRPSR